ETVLRKAKLVAVDNSGQTRTDVAEATESFVGYRSKYLPYVARISAVNPLPHDRRPTKGKVEPNVTGWTHEVAYTCFFSQAARALSPTALDQPRLRVTLLFGTGSEAHRHGVLGSVESSAQPTLLIIVSGIEPSYDIEFTNPANPGQKATLQA